MLVRLRQEPELPEDRVHVRLDGLRADDELLADPAVRQPFGHQRQHLALARRELAERIVLASPPEELADDLGIDRRPSLPDAPDGVQEVVDLEHAVLQQVAEAVGPLADERQRVRRLDDPRALLVPLSCKPIAFRLGPDAALGFSLPAPPEIS
jgi:hypothetical protein